MKTIGSVVRQWRLGTGMNTTQLAAKVGHGVKRQNIEQLESDEVSRPRYLDHLARVMGYTYEDLVALRRPPASPQISGKNPLDRSPSGKIASYDAPVPFVVWRRIGGTILLSNTELEADEGPAILAVAPVGPRVKATVVPDATLVGELEPGTIVLLDPDMAPQDGDVVLVKMRDGTHHLRLYRLLADGSFEVQTTAPRVQTWNSAAHGVTVEAVVTAEYRQRRRSL